MNPVWSHLVGWIVQGAQLLLRAATNLVGTVLRLAGTICAVGVTALHAAARWVLAQVRAVVGVLKRMASGAAFPVQAWLCADAWDGIAVASLRERQRNDPSTSAVRDRWQGIAADRYYDVAVEQAHAVDGALAGAELVREQLRDCASVTGILYGALFSGMVQFLGVICAATVLTATGVAAPEGIGAAVGAVARFAALVLAVVAAICVYHLQSGRIPEALADVFPGGWPSPHAVTFADASLSDGDTTDWRLWM